MTPERADAFADELRGLVERCPSHSSLVTMLAAGVEDARPYLALEYMAAESLDVALRHYAPAPLASVLPFVSQLARAIDAAHDAGMLHGGIHPRDIFVTPEQARLSGVGIAAALERAGLRAPIRRPYSAPERVAGEPWGSRADVFSLAAVTFELLTGRRVAGTGREAAGAPLDPGPDIDAAVVRQALAAALADDPADRFWRADDFAAALAEAITGRTSAGPSARPASAAVARQPEEAGPAGGSGDGLGRLAGVPDSGREAADGSRIVDLASHPRSGRSRRRRPRANVEPSSPPEVVEPPDRVSALAGAEGEVLDSVRRDELDEPGTGPTLFDELEGRHTPEPFRPPFDIETARAADFEDPADEGRLERRWEEADGGEGLRENDSEGDAESGDVHAAGPAPVYGVHVGSAGDGELSDFDVPPPADRPRPAMLPFALTLLVGLLVGFVAGYGLGGREVRVALPLDEAEDGDAVVAEAALPAPPDSDLPPAGEIQAPPPLLDPPVAAEAADPGPGPQEPVVPPPVPGPLPEPAPAASPPVPSPPPAEAVPAGAPAAGRGAVFVESRPAGARVTLEGDVVGTTPVLVPDLREGSYQVHLELEGYRTWQVRVRVEPGERTRVAGSLEPGGLR